MQFRPRLLTLFTCAAVSALPHLASAQVLYSDTTFNAASYTTSSAGSIGAAGPVRFNINYSNIDIFGDGFLTAQIPPSPRGTGGDTTGVFLSANNNSFVTGDSGFSAIIPNAAAANNIGTGTANPNYVLRVDVFNSTGAGIINNGTLGSNGALTTYSYVGINQANTTLQLAEQNAPSTTGTLAGQGMGLAITADAGAGDDFLPHYGGKRYIDRGLTDTTAPQVSQGSQPTVDTGLIGKELAKYWVTQGFDFNVPTPNATTDNDLIRTTGDNLYPTPDPADPAAWRPALTGPFKRVYLDAFPQHNEPLHLTGGGVTPPTTELAPNNRLPGGVPYNQWATHELYWVDGTFTYAVTYDGVTIPLLQITPDNDGLNANDNIFSALSRAGAPVLAFYDRFDSIAVGPDGGNFAIYDNLEIAVADAGDVPSLTGYLDDNGYTLADPGIEGDFDEDGDVDGRDFLAWQRGISPTPFSPADLATWQTAYNGGALAAVTSVPEPSSLIILLGVAGCGLLARRQG